MTAGLQNSWGTEAKERQKEEQTTPDLQVVRNLHTRFVSAPRGPQISSLLPEFHGFSHVSVLKVSAILHSLKAVSFKQPQCGNEWQNVNSKDRTRDLLAGQLQVMSPR